MVVGIDKCPPRNLLVLGDSPFRAGGEEDEKTIDEVQYLIVGDTNAGEKVLESDSPIGNVLGQSRRQNERRAT